jgi:predicted peptidase
MDARAMNERSVLHALALVIAISGCGGDANDGSTGGAGGATSAARASGGAPSTASASNGSTSDESASSGGPSSSASTGAGGLPDGPSSDRLTLRPIGTVPGAPLGYAEYLPPGYGNGEKRPMILFHHGIGESGDGTDATLGAVLSTGLTALIEHDEWPSDRPFIILAPQHDAPPNTSCHSAGEIDDFTKFALTHYDVDPKRVYLTGLSCGAIGSWNYLGAHIDEVFAAAVLISGNGHGAFSQAGCDLGRIPIWAFHGDMDQTVDPSGSIDPLNALQACTNPPAVDAKLTIYPGVGHNAWDRTYDLSAGNDIYAWMLGHLHP